MTTPDGNGGETEKKLLGSAAGARSETKTKGEGTYA